MVTFGMKSVIGRKGADEGVLLLFILYLSVLFYDFAAIIFVILTN